MAKQKQPIYVLPHGIEVIGEYPARGKNRYCRVRIRPHRFFPDVPVVGNGIGVRKSRVILASKLGRALTAEEHAHHGDEDRDNDAPDNLETLSAADHNRHHKIGTKHSDEAKERISKGLKLAIKEGRRDPPPRQDWTGKNHSESSKNKMSETHARLIASGQIEKPVPPLLRGEASSTSKLTEDRVLEIRRRAAAGESKMKLAKEFGVVHQSVYNIINRLTWSHI